MKLSAALDVFLEDYVWLRGYSNETARNYKLAVNSFMSSNSDLDINEISMEHIKKWKHDMEKARRDINGQISYLYRIRLLLRWLKRKYDLNIDLDDLIIPKRAHKLPNYFQPKDIDKLIDGVPPDRYKHNELRNKAILALFYSSGIRLGELRRIRLRDIRDNEIIIHGKGNKERPAFIDVRAARYIKAYLEARPYNSEYLFTTFRNKPMDKTSIEKICRKASRGAGFSQAITPHTFRHSFATHLLQNGCNLRHIQEFLGHADISTTQIYTHVADPDLRVAYKQFHY